jgi:hypothetical protein
MTEKSEPPTPVKPKWVSLRPYQVEAGRAITDSILAGKGLSFSVQIARQGGKNELSARIEAWLLGLNFQNQVDAVKCAPSFDPQGRISMRRLSGRLAEHKGLRPYLSQERGYIVRFGDARIIFLSASPEANVVGHTARLLLEVDEAQDVSEEKFDRDFRPMASISDATTVYYGTAWNDTTLLERAKQRHLELERKDGIRRHFEYDWQHVARAHPAYGKYVEAERQRLGEHHPLFRTQYLLKPIAGGGRLFTPAQLAQLQGRHPRQPDPRDGEAYVAGLDLGGGALIDEGETNGAAPSPGAHDATVLTIARATYPQRDALLQEPKLEVIQHYPWTGVPHDALVPRLTDLLREVWCVKRLAVDATGLGETIARMLTAALGSDVVKPLRFSL